MWPAAPARYKGLRGRSPWGGTDTLLLSQRRRGGARLEPLNVGFTGMRVIRHDGRSPHHLVGVKPDVTVRPTLAGLRAGHDEVLERGLALAGAGAVASGM